MFSVHDKAVGQYVRAAFLTEEENKICKNWSGTKNSNWVKNKTDLNRNWKFLMNTIKRLLIVEHSLDKGVEKRCGIF